MVEKSQAGSFWPTFYEPFRSLGLKMGDWLAPASDATSDDKTYRITMELPGVTEKDVEISVDDGVVTVKGEKKSDREEKGDTWFFSERQYGAFNRSFRLPPDADGAALSADLNDGVLVLTAPKLAPEGAARARKVPIGRAA